jgi:neurotransmitter:Na+ symporter, NSS family
MARTREHFGSRLGFILAAAGSAVGLGNIWRFPYVAGENGGGLFLILYVIFVFTIGLSVMLAEFVIGRAAERNPVGAFAKLKGGAWPIVGYMGVAAGFIILSFYGVVAGWTLFYVVQMASGALSGLSPDALGQLFGSFSADPLEPIFYQGLFMMMTIGVVHGGVGGGIEQSCRVLMPLLFILLLGLVLRSVTLPGAEKGLAFFLEPDFSKVSGELFNAALAQAFFSLSLGMGAMTTYGSYLPHYENLPRSAIWVTSLDTLVAILAGLLILPAVFAFGFDPSAGPGLTFITLPAVFSEMPFGGFFGTLFFILLSVAALTSAISLLEVVVAFFVDEKGMKRSTATTLSGVVIFLIGIPSSLSLGIWSDVTVSGKGILDLMDYIASNLLLPLGGIFISLFVGWVILPKALEEATSYGKHPFAWAAFWTFICRYVAPLAVAWTLLMGL